MSKYILNKNKQDSPSGENYEVHNEGDCIRLPLNQNRIYLGEFLSCKSAMIKAFELKPEWKNRIDGCYWCCSSCHKE